MIIPNHLLSTEYHMNEQNELKKKCSSVREFPYFFPASVYVPLGQDGLLGLQINASYDYIKHQS